MSAKRKVFIFVALPLLAIFASSVALSLMKQESKTTSLGEDTKSRSICDRIALLSPVDVSKPTVVLYPGQTRGGDFKPHGGFRFDGLRNEDVTVIAPLSARITDGGRYIEAGEVQYLFDFRTDCGLEYRLDHLRTLSPKLQAIADELPVAKVDDSRTTNVGGDFSVIAGEIIASAVGFEKGLDGSNRPNVGFDFGLYDTRQENEASKDLTWATAHRDESSQAFYAVCWLDLLPESDAVVLKSLPAGDGQSGKQSDYCR